MMSYSCTFCATAWGSEGKIRPWPGFVRSLHPLFATPVGTIDPF
jgi:hypothetical protein